MSSPLLPDSQEHPSARADADDVDVDVDADADADAGGADDVFAKLDALLDKLHTPRPEDPPEYLARYNKMIRTIETKVPEIRHKLETLLLQKGLDEEAVDESPHEKGGSTVSGRQHAADRAEHDDGDRAAADDDGGAADDGDGGAADDGSGGAADGSGGAADDGDSGAADDDDSGVEARKARGGAEASKTRDAKTEHQRVRGDTDSQRRHIRGGYSPRPQKASSRLLTRRCPTPALHRTRRRRYRRSPLHKLSQAAATASQASSCTPADGAAPLGVRELLRSQWGLTDL